LKSGLGQAEPPHPEQSVVAPHGAEHLLGPSPHTPHFGIVRIQARERLGAAPVSPCTTYGAPPRAGMAASGLHPE
jgi:hypothetical protein